MMRQKHHRVAFKVTLVGLALLLAATASASRAGPQQHRDACGDGAPKGFCQHVAAAGCSWPLDRLCSHACGACSPTPLPTPLQDVDGALPPGCVLFPAMHQPSTSTRRLAAAEQPAPARKPTGKPASIKRPTTPIPVKPHAPTRKPAPKSILAAKQPAKPTAKPALATKARAATTPTPQFTYAAQMHNAYRARHEATPALVYDAGLEASAQAWADKCIWAHSGTPGVGENLYEMFYWTSGPPPALPQTWAAGIAAWYDEIALYSYAAPGFSEATGHFTQVVWVDSTQVGCGVSSCPQAEGISSRIFVCQYSPPGNVDAPSYFRANVLPLKPVGG